MRLLTAAAVAGLLAQGMAQADQRAMPTIDPSQSCTPPLYPAHARRVEAQGTVVLRFLIGPDGIAQKSEIVSSSGYDELDQAARDALQLCHFKPAQLDGRPDPSPAWALLRYTWKLQEANGAPAAQVFAPPPSAPFVLKCSGKPSDADFADQVAAIVPAQLKAGGTGRLLLPPVGGAAQTACAERYYRALAEVLKRSEIFDRFEVAETGIEDVRPAARGEDYTLWVEGNGLAVSYRGGPRGALLNNSQGLAAWLGAVPNSLRLARERQGSTGYTITTALIGGHPYIAYHGKEYLSTAAIENAVRRDEIAEARALKAGAPMGKRLHVVLASEAALIARAEANTANAAKTMASASRPEGFSTLALGQLSLMLVDYGVSQGRAEALRQARLYETIDVEEGEPADPPIGSYDAVIWNNPAAPLRWKVKDSLGVAHDVTVTETTAQAWLEAVRSALAIGALPK